MHTSELFASLTRAEFDEAISTARAFIDSVDAEGKILISRAGSGYGIKKAWFYMHKDSKGVKRYGCTLRINLQRLVNGGEQTMQLFHSEDADKLTLALQSAIEKLTGIEALADLQRWSTTRIDYTVDLHVGENVSTYIEIAKKGDKPTGTKEVKTYPGGATWGNKSWEVAVYDKYAERVAQNEEYREKHGKPWYSDLELEEARGIVRFEYRLFNPGTQRQKYAAELPDKNLLYFIADDAILDGIKVKMRAAFQKIFGKADYYSMKEAMRFLSPKAGRIPSRTVHPPHKYKNLVNLCTMLELIDSADNIAEARQYCTDFQRTAFDKYIRQLNEAVNINPVTIPAKSGKNGYLPSLHGDFEAALKKL